MRFRMGLLWVTGDASAVLPSESREPRRERRCLGAVSLSVHTGCPHTCPLLQRGEGLSSGP